MSSFQQILVEIVEKIQIEQNFHVHHADYISLELKPEAAARFQQMPSLLQRKYLTIQVQNYLYDIYFSHSLLSLTEIEAEAQQPSQIKNNIIDGIDVAFYQRLRQSNPSDGYLDFGWEVLANADNDELIIVKDGLHLHIKPQQHLPQEFKQAAIGDVVAIYLPHNLVGEDTYIMVGNSGTPGAFEQSSDDRVPSVQLYFNFTPDAAVTISEKLAHQLNKLEIPFQFAILHDPALFYCYDCGTLWLSQAGYLEAQTFLAKIYREHQTEFSANVPLFTKQLAPGLGLAEVPTTAGTFGMQRCEILATGLLAAIDRGQTLDTDKLQTVYEHFITAGIDWLQTYLNPAGIDYYGTFVI